MTDDPDRMPFINDGDIQAVIWFCRILPLAMLAIVGVLFLVNAHSQNLDRWPQFGAHHIEGAS